MHEEVNISALHEFLLEQLHLVPITKRIGLMRALAAVVGSARHARELRAMATELEKIEAQHQQLVLDFKRRAEG